ncbi:TonB-dependent receptor domain-containing protein [Pseudomonas proteolytica]|uniref:TonB-dependent receptor domain-containing protein n=1 Tax=Pseudomonas proteolytica TaxID=219574 RepID=UPI00320A14AD
MDGRLNASLAIFYTRQDSVAQSDIGHLLPDGSLAYYATSGTKSQGFDIDVSGELSEGYSHYTTGTSTSLSTELPRTTTQLLTTYHRHDPLDKLTMGGGATWQSRFTRMQPVHSTVQVEQKAYTLASLMAR